jgi:hypothetical protein
LKALDDAAGTQPAAAAEGRIARGSRFLAAAFLGLQVLALAAFGFLIPPDSPFFPRCAFYALTKLYCPGCGTGRGILRILHGDILGGIRQNWLLLIGIPVLALADLNALLALFGKKKLFDLDTIKHGATILAALIIFYWIARNIPFFPFTLLAPQATAIAR